MNDRPSSIQEFRDMLLYGRGLMDSRNTVVNPKSGTGGLAQTTLPPEVLEALAGPPRKPASWGRRLFGMALFTLILAGGGFGAAYLFLNPPVQEQPRGKPLIQNLPSKNPRIAPKAMEHPLQF